MHIIYRAEVDAAAHPALGEVSDAVAALLQTLIDGGPLKDLDVKIRYIPIVMDESGRQLYKARSGLERKNRMVTSPEVV